MTVAVSHGSRADKSRHISVCLLSPHPVVLTQFQDVLSRSGIQVLVLQLLANLKPESLDRDLPAADLYVVDAHSGEAATKSLLQDILSRQPSARLLVIAETFTTESAYAFLRRGAKGLLTYSEARDHLPKATSQVTGDGFWVPRAILSGFVDQLLGDVAAERLNASAPDLTPREQQVLEALLKNFSNKEIANELHLSERTVKFHVSRLLQKFGVHRRADLIVLCYQKSRA